MKKCLPYLCSILLFLFINGCGPKFSDPKPEIHPTDTKNITQLNKLEELKKACNDKNAVACFKLAELYKASGANKYKNLTSKKRKYTDHPKFDYSKSLLYYSEACWLGYSPGCIKRAERYSSGYYLEKHYPGADYSRAAKAYRFACDGKENNVEGCKGLCRLYLHIDIDYDKAKKYCKKACDLGNGISCDNLDFLFYKGQGDIYKTPTDSVNYYGRLCHLNDIYACMKLGQMYHQGKGVIKDYSMASQYYKKACDLNESLGCSGLGLLYREGQGVKKDLSKAKFYFDKACNKLHGANGCILYGDMQRKGY